MTDSPLSEAPLGWFAAAFSSELRPRQVLSRKLFGRDVVLFRNEEGFPCVADAHCPHLGSHLGRGVVDNGCLRCPYHGFRFDVGGECVSTGYGTQPPRAQLRTWPIDERNGVLFVYHDPLSRAPSWRLPNVDESGWTAPLFRSFETEGHPQEMAENPVDIGHLTCNHGYRDVRMVTSPRFDTHVFRVCYTMSRFFGLGGIGRAVPIEFSVEVNGFGFTQIETLMPTLGLRTRLIAMATPTEPGRVRLRLALSVAHALAGREPRSLPARLWRPRMAAEAARLLFPVALRDVGQDIEMWRGKRHLERPGLARGDGPLMAYRHWARQFYLGASPEPPASGKAPVEQET